MEPDPLGMKPGLNPYAYAGNNPVNNVDPNGLDCIGGSCSSGFEQGMYDYLPGYKAGTGIYNSFESGSNQFSFWEGVDAVGSIAGGVGKSIQFVGKLAETASIASKGEAAVAARNALSDSLAPLKGKAPATVTAGYNEKTGEVVAKACGGGKCAEDHVFEALGGNKDDVKFTSAMRPRTGEEVPVCGRCEATYGRAPFPEGTQFKSDVGK
ncbi:MAG: RHS repeat-associated core domain-containing protein [Gammaproteobacteria bacterium]